MTGMAKWSYHKLIRNSYNKYNELRLRYILVYKFSWPTMGGFFFVKFEN